MIRASSVKVGHANFTMIVEIPSSEEVLTGIFYLFEHPIIILFDSVASHDFFRVWFYGFHHENPTPPCRFYHHGGLPARLSGSPGLRATCGSSARTGSTSGISAPCGLDDACCASHGPGVPSYATRGHTDTCYATRGFGVSCCATRDCYTSYGHGWSTTS
jgi:hypothetical protein